MIVVFVIQRLKGKQKQGLLVEKKSKSAQNLVNSLIPIGMLFGGSGGVITGMFFPVSLLFTFSIGTGAGYLAGYIAYEIYSQKGTFSQR
ncbi:hypothetical protein MM300_19810 [Evansella sp. LMS18]|uniref:hypothetical protein n=1 Tax=Evansella sp. LMS18 TaxID=2924033 RepID=UPI0020D1E99C|nr:hypothetical protein [Evansella sp. LMS18]UTR10098.1 hypothetical protein MM300_19810 [Evansella sp. LMS18]